MAKYAVVKDNAVVETHDLLPRNWKNISGLNILSAAELKHLGWYPIVKEENLTIDPLTQRTGKTLLVVRENDVLETQEIINRSQEEMTQMAQISRSTNTNELRELRNQLLSLTDWTQLNDIPEETRLLWADYRQKLRDLMLVYAENYTEDFKTMLPVPPVAMPQLTALY